MLALGARDSVTRVIVLPAGNRLVSLQRVPGWPLVVTWTSLMVTFGAVTMKNWLPEAPALFTPKTT